MTDVYFWQEPQLPQRDCVMFRVSEYFAKSLEVIENGTIQKVWYSRV